MDEVNQFFGEKEGLGGELGVELSHGVCLNKR